MRCDALQSRRVYVLGYFFNMFISQKNICKNNALTGTSRKLKQPAEAFAAFR